MVAIGDRHVVVGAEVSLKSHLYVLPKGLTNLVGTSRQMRTGIVVMPDESQYIGCRSSAGRVRPW